MFLLFGGAVETIVKSTSTDYWAPPLSLLINITSPESSLIAEVILALVRVTEAEGEEHQTEEDDVLHMISYLILLVFLTRGLINCWSEPDFEL